MVSIVQSDSYRLPQAPTGKQAVSAILPRNRPPAALRPRESVAFVRRRPETLFGVKAVGSFVPRLTRKAFEKYGFSAATLITDWPTIVGVVKDVPHNGVEEKSGNPFIYQLMQGGRPGGQRCEDKCQVSYG